MATAANAQSLSSVLNSTASLSALNGLLAQFPNLATSLGSAQNVTLLAPSNQAISAYLNSSLLASAGMDPEGLIEAVLYVNMNEIMKEREYPLNLAKAVPHPERYLLRVADHGKDSVHPHDSHQ